jgi:hypothetical protein
MDPLLQRQIEPVTETFGTETFGDAWDALVLDGVEYSIEDDEATPIPQVVKGQEPADRAVHAQRLGQWL